MPRINLYFSLLSPMAHGDPALNADMGNFSGFRKQHVVGVGDVPILSGNAIRGVLRRVLMRHFLSAAGMTPEAYPNAPGHWDRIYAALSNGGTLTGSEKSVNTKQIRELRQACPPLSLLGAAMYSFMLPGVTAIMDAYPQCVELMGREPRYVDAGEHSLSELYGDRHHVRHISADVDRAAAEITPMPYTTETLNPGTVLQGGIILDRTATEIERDCASWGFSQIQQLGGNIAKGMGLVSITFSEPLGTPERYEAWVAEHAAAARPLIEAAIPVRAVKV